MNFLERVNKFCINNRVTITEIEETCGLEKGTFLKWDKKSLSLKKAYKIAMYFGLTLDELIREREVRRKSIPSH